MLEDQLRSIRQYYYDMPAPLRNLIGYMYRKLPTDLRYGKDYKHFSELIARTEYFADADLQELQLGLLKETIGVAASRIPYYQRIFAEYGVGIKDLQVPDDIRKFPYLTKQDVKKNYSDLINPDISARFQLVTTTGGSTAEPMRFLQMKGTTRSKERAFIYNGWSRIGYKPGDRAVQLKGRTVGRPSEGIHWEYESIQNILEMDSSFLSESNIPRYLTEIEKFNAKFCIAFPSSLYLVAKFISDSGTRAPRFQAIMLASENVYPWQRVEIEKVFGCRVFSHYGHSEMVLLGMESEDSRNLLFYPQYGYLEVIREDGMSATNSGETGEIVGTSFHNPVMPFIRYRTQDVGTVGCQAGEKRHYSILSNVEGRLQEFIVTQDQRLISITTMGAAHFDILDNVFAMQYYQEEVGVLVLNVVPKGNYCARDRERISNAVLQKVGGGLRIEVREVDDIMRTRSGKHLMLIQKIDIANTAIRYSDSKLYDVA